MYDCGCSKIGLTICDLIGIFLGIIAGIATGVVFSLGLIPSIINFVIIALAVAGISLLVLLISLLTANNMKGYNGSYRCICKSGKLVLTGTIGTLIAATLAITAGFTATAIISIIFVALTAFFFVLLITSLVCLFSCIIKQNCRCRDEIEY